MIKVLYYYYYLFYTKILPDNQPHATVIFTLSLTLSFILNVLINITLAYFLQFALNQYEMIVVFLFIILILYYSFYKNGKGKRIVSIEKPKLYNNTISIIATLLFFILGIICLFIDPDLTRFILKNWNVSEFNFRIINWKSVLPDMSFLKWENGNACWLRYPCPSGYTLH